MRSPKIQQISIHNMSSIRTEQSRTFGDGGEGFLAQRQMMLGTPLIQDSASLPARVSLVLDILTHTLYCAEINVPKQSH